MTGLLYINVNIFNRPNIGDRNIMQKLCELIVQL